jgi:serine protease Do
MRLLRSQSVHTRLARAAFLALGVAVAVPAGMFPMVAPAYARGAPDSFADLAAKLLPAVVNVSSTSTIQAKNGAPGPETPLFPPGSPFEQFFKDFMDRNRPGGPQQQTPDRKSQSLGSGFIIDPSGLIVTNNHVIDGADEITVTLQDNTSLKATLVGRDEREDVALLRVKSDKPLPAVAFGDSNNSRVGDWVLAIGNPFGLGGTVTAGIVSARGRDIRQGPYDDFIQTDAAINRGNSGGPLFNMDGEVIGINTAIYSPSGGSIGIGFSIPANNAKPVVAQLKDFGRARRGWLGVRIQQVTPDIAESLGLKDATGAMVAGVNDGGPAEAAKIRNGDIILKFNGQDVKEMRTLPRLVAETPIGQDVPVTLWRDGKEMTITAKLGELPDEPKVAAATPGTPGAKPEAAKPTAIEGLGLMLSLMTPEARERFQLGANQKGVVIAEVTPNGSAAEKGLKAGDVIVEVQQEPVSTPADVQKRVDGVRKQNRKSVLMLIQSQDGIRFLALPLAAPGKDQKPG